MKALRERLLNGVALPRHALPLDAAAMQQNARVLQTVGASCGWLVLKRIGGKLHYVEVTGP